MQRIASVLVVGLLTAALVGCGSSGPSVHKTICKVTLDGEPLPDAKVTFHIQGEKPMARKPSGQADADGNAVIAYLHKEERREGAPAGEYKITVALPKDTGQDPNMSADDAMEIYMKDQMASKAKNDDLDTTGTDQLIPEMYAAVSSTPFTFTVEENDDNVFELKLEKKPKK